MTTVTQLAPFKNEPFTNFSQEENKKSMAAALAKVKMELGRKYPLVIGEEKLFTEEQTISINPGNVDEVIGSVSKGNKELAEKAMQEAMKSFETWKKVSPAERAEYLFKAADLMRQRKHEFSSYLVYESGKNWAEADADTAEAIDFLEFYAREMIRLSETSIHQPLVNIEGEDNQISYIPLGVGIVISPFNFPLAIMAGTTVAAIVSGNTVILKPADATPVIAAKFVELMEEVGLPSGVLNYLPGDGIDVGEYLVEHPSTRFISFTGSRAVGCRIYERASKVQPGQLWLKRVIAEMGGKDGVVVDETADLDAAASAIVASAFGFQGQKCSAGSRAIIVESVYDEVVEKVTELTKNLTVGLPEENYAVGPVIDQKSVDKIMGYIEIGKTEGRLLTGGSIAEGNGFYIQPTVIADVQPKARIMQEEIFGPVLALAKAANWQEAIEIYNDTDYGLTGAYHSQNEERIHYALENMHCGNLYINKKCTGALVGAHPFGGFNMSGTDSKAGGYDYLLLFTQAKLKSRKL
ncbi:L-glutamate gamma-semialdehyde dehydrogenase [Neobacillus sp. SuZ13]|uniref:L-glutamate gamma-semialdehyde dehydrogenase n=1 Tax=Neobacillus sp. SuZ13 TaxID=3047875 RepID=UPI0024BF7E52|nr:L-glutamate gamma-semialdehyde dehydrogenase [Neobacillus sp. SuZ13]WHY64483.1 L-glutamate gamma-semialdehyde dehydrogenase [Neobacillus sp. SuZ13]